MKHKYAQILKKEKKLRSKYFLFYHCYVIIKLWCRQLTAYLYSSIKLNVTLSQSSNIICTSSFIMFILHNIISSLMVADARVKAVTMESWNSIHTISENRLGNH